ncbi:MAG: hypothetical protein WBA16_05265 [Nonlabens sp.]
MDKVKMHRLIYRCSSLAVGITILLYPTVYLAIVAVMSLLVIQGILLLYYWWQVGSKAILSSLYLRLFTLTYVLTLLFLVLVKWNVAYTLVPFLVSLHVNYLAHVLCCRTHFLNFYTHERT